MRAVLKNRLLVHKAAKKVLFNWTANERARFYVRCVGRERRRAMASIFCSRDEASDMQLKQRLESNLFAKPLKKKKGKEWKRNLLKPEVNIQPMVHSFFQHAA